MCIHCPIRHARKRSEGRLQWPGFLEAPLHGRAIAVCISGAGRGRSGSRSGSRSGQGGIHGVGIAILAAIVLAGRGRGPLQKNP
jgi:hypothetical protein